MPSLSALLQKLLLSLTFALFANAASAMFIQPDWLDPTEPGVGTNRYAYSANDPINKLDPGGNLSYNTEDEEFFAEEGDTIESISEDTGLEADDLLALNEGLTLDDPISNGAIVSLGDSANVRTFKHAAGLIGDGKFAQAARYNDYFSEGFNKCNCFVSVAIEAGHGSFPTRMHDGSPVPSLAADWFSAAHEGMSLIRADQAQIGDVISWRVGGDGFWGKVQRYAAGASGHAMIYSGGVSVVSGGNVYRPDGGGGAIGAAGSIGGTHRSQSFMNDTRMYQWNRAEFTRYSR